MTALIITGGFPALCVTTYSITRKVFFQIKVENSLPFIVGESLVCAVRNASRGRMALNQGGSSGGKGTCIADEMGAANDCEKGMCEWGAS